MDLEKIEKVLGEDVRIALEDTQTDGWGLEDALTADWTSHEKEPPEGSDFDNWTVPQTLTIYTPHMQIIDEIRRKGDLRSDSHAVKCGLRYGLPTIFREWQDTISQLGRYRDVASQVSEYIPRGGVYDRFDETDILAVDWGRKVDERTIRVVWNQKGIIKSLSEALGVDQADIVRWALLVVGDELANRGEVGPGLEDDIEDSLNEVEYRVNNTAARQRSVTRAIISDALSGDHGQEAISLLKEDYRAMFREFMSEAEFNVGLEEEKSSEFPDPQTDILDDM